ncbi:unnamed protein product, partial [marine sediment metagenome]
VVGSIETVRADFSAEIQSKREYATSIWPMEGVPDSF